MLFERTFFKRSTLELSKDLIGQLITVRQEDGTLLKGIINETEAYCSGDKAAHCYGKKTERNKAMFGEEGCCYVYRIYGRNVCFNATGKAPEIKAGATLIRSIIPLEGKDKMKARRPKAKKDRDISNGPSKLSQALGIGMEDYGIDLCTLSSKIYLEQGPAFDLSLIQTTKRIGISKDADRLWRFYLPPADYKKIEKRQKSVRKKKGKK